MRNADVIKRSESPIHQGERSPGPFGDHVGAQATPLMESWYVSGGKAQPLGAGRLHE